MANSKNFWGDFASKAAGAAAGPLGELGVSLLAGSLLKPNQNPFLAQQQADYARKRRLNNYYDKYLQDQQDLYNKYNPVYQKTTDMAIEAANKPLTSTDTFKGIGPVNDIMNTQNQQSNAAATQVANNAGLYGGARVGLQNSVNNAGQSAITKSLSDFASNYEATAPARMAAAQGMAANAYGNASQGMLGAAGALNQSYSDLINTGQALGQQTLDSRNDLLQRQTALMQMLGNMYESQNNERMFNKQLAANKAISDRQIAAMEKAGTGTSTPYVPSLNTGPIGSGFPSNSFTFNRPSAFQYNPNINKDINIGFKPISIGAPSIKDQIAANRRLGLPTYQNGVIIDRGY